MRMKCIEHIQNALKEHEQIVIVVSAIGRNGDPYSTDSLLNLTEAFSKPTLASDLAAACGELIAAAVLSAELTEVNIKNTVLHSEQTGIKTTGEFGNGVIKEIDTRQILNSFKHTNVIVIPGFQGMNHTGQIQTLGRGGSDLTAIALCSALHASHVEFYKDVAGVMSADPTIDKHCRKLDYLSFDEFLPLLDTKRPIIQKRAAIHAKKEEISLYIRGISETVQGTWIYPS